MKLLQHRKSLILVAAAGIAAIGLSARFAPTPPTAHASDHIDSPTLAHDHASDIGDNWAFLDPNDNSRVVLVMSTNPFLISSEAIGQYIFDHNVRYRFEIENTGDAKPDTFVDVTYSKGVGRLQPQTATISLPNGRKFTALTTIGTQDDTPPDSVITVDRESGVQFFAGAVDDPFFLDNTAANRFVLSALKNPGHPDKAVFERGRDTYAGFNTLVTVVSLPAAMLKGKGNVIGINAVTQRQSGQRVQKDGTVMGSGAWLTLDRDGGPLVNNGLIPAARKDEYNAASTMDDAKGRFRADIVKSLNAVGTDAEHQKMFLKVAVDGGDILRLDLSVPNRGTGGGNNPDGGFGNMGGRRLSDDIVDKSFTLLNNGQPLGDHVDANEVPFRDTFPFVASPIQPNPKGVKNEDDRTRL
ncbi:hypothetical protein IAD21_05045 [Abditibacteriota bacterium]|nr:hypothetical protein IAD21_05045 [Abditibacteriota bacterium]